MPVSELSLLEVLANAKGKYDVSVISTFNAYLPFYEDIVFHRLRNAGCRGNVLLMDSNQFHFAFNETFYRPRFAGTGYTLIPIEVANRCFHPKIILLAGKEHCALYIGSHNQTLSGFGRNRELTASFEINKKSGNNERGVILDAWRAIRNWTANQPEELLAALALAEETAGWALIGAGERAESESSFFATFQGGNPLWQQVKEKLPKKVKRATLIAPFFGENLTFLQTLISDLGPEECIVGIDPTTVHIVPDARELLPGVKFVETDSLYGGRGYLHAKSILLEAETEDEYLIIGSANASRSAWLEVSTKRNFEAVVMIRSTNESVALSLGLKDLANCPEVSPDRWELVTQNSDNPESVEASMIPLLVAVETEEGFEIVLPEALRDQIKAAELIAADGSLLAEVALEQNEFGRDLIKVDENVTRLYISKIRIRKHDGDFVGVFVHHTNEIVRSLSNSKYKEFFSNLEGLDFGVSEEFWKLINKITFDDGDELPDNLSVKFSEKDNTQDFRSQERDTPAPQEVFSVPITTSGRLKGWANIPQDDLGKFLAFINKRLYAPPEQTQGVPIRTSEEELIDSDDEDGTQTGDERDRIKQLAELCRKGTKTMMTRMTSKLKRIIGGDARGAYTAIRQLSVVLGCLHLIRELETREVIRPRTVSFIEKETEWTFFRNVVKLLYSGRENIIDKVTANERLLNEMSTVIGMLIWLAYDVYLDIARMDTIQDRLYSDSYDDGWDVDTILHGSARLLKLAPAFCQDNAAKEIAERVLKADDGRQWLEEHLEWMELVTTASMDVSLLPAPNRNPQIGDYAYPKMAEKPELLIVKNNPDGVHLIDLSREDEIRKLGRGYAVIVSMPSPLADAP